MTPTRSFACPGIEGHAAFQVIVPFATYVALVGVTTGPKTAPLLLLPRLHDPLGYRSSIWHYLHHQGVVDNLLLDHIDLLLQFVVSHLF